MKTKAPKISALGRAVRRAMAEARASAREVDRGSGVSADTLSKLVTGQTRAMTEANLARLAAYFSAVLGRAITADAMRKGKIR